MRPRIVSRLLATGISVALISGAAHVASSADTPEATDLNCPESTIQKTLKNGAAWRMCASIHPLKGLVLEQVEFKPASGEYEYLGYKRVLDQIYLAQLNVPYDGAMANYNDITEYGFGGNYLVEQTSDLCLGDTIEVHQSARSAGRLIERTIPGMCTDEVQTGLASNSVEGGGTYGTRFTTQGTALEVSSMSQISWYEYQQRVTFGDHGQIDVGLGATGDLAPTASFYTPDPSLGWPIGSEPVETAGHAASHRHNAIYRVDFGIDEGSRQQVEEWDYTHGGDSITPKLIGARTVKSSAFSVIPSDHDSRTWWRVLNPGSLNKDGHARSYEIVNPTQGDDVFAVTKPTLSFTNNHPCQEYASDNLNPGCPDQSVLDYVADESEPLTDPVAWVNVSFHHIVRDEEQSPMPTHWQSFQLVPRDFFAQNPSTVEARRCINGLQTASSTVSDRPCIATMWIRPLITSDTDDIGPGSMLTTTSGTWDTSRTTWNYSYLWFRDGQPILTPGGEPELGTTYVVTDADRGHAITVKVTASQTGYGSGTAESLPVVVPSGATSTPTPRPTPTPSKTTATVKPKPKATSRTSAHLAHKKVTTKQNARVRVTVKAGSNYATGRVRVRYGSKVLKTAMLKNGKVTIKLSKLRKARSYRLRVEYVGNSQIKPSRSKFITLRVHRA